MSLEEKAQLGYPRPAEFRRDVQKAAMEVHKQRKAGRQNWWEWEDEDDTPVAIVPAVQDTIIVPKRKKVTFSTSNDLYYLSHFIDLSDEDYEFLYQKPKRERSTYSSALKNMPCPTAPRKAIRTARRSIIAENEPAEPSPRMLEPDATAEVQTHKRHRCESQDEGRTNPAKRVRINPPVDIVQGPRTITTIPTTIIVPKRKKVTFSTSNDLYYLSLFINLCDGGYEFLY